MEPKYEQLTTSFKDLSIAEMNGYVNVVKTFWDLFCRFKYSYKELTDLAMALNTKWWDCTVKHNYKYAKLYGDLCSKVDEYANAKLEYMERKYFNQNLYSNY